MMPIILGALLMLAVVVLPGWWVQRVMKRYATPTDRYPGTGAELARRLLDHAGLESVAVEPTEHGDHYDPEARAVRLTEANFNTCSLTAITVAAHEVGHAIQHADGYQPLIVRTRMVRSVQRFQRLGMLLIGAAPVALAAIKLPQAALILAVFGLAGLASGIFVHLATLPTELDASFRRALPILERGGFLKPEDRRPARRILTAAALTYVAASMMSLVNFAWWLRVLRP
ncbi:MAG: zinc metallopeptidase [Wenzhouxiangellaceae bacterium]|nr:zinc metallopeptidase [Wenzhouxiangellaceae bacterium]